MLSRQASLGGGSNGRKGSSNASINDTAESVAASATAVETLSINSNLIDFNSSTVNVAAAAAGNSSSINSAAAAAKNSPSSSSTSSIG